MKTALTLLALSFAATAANAQVVINGDVTTSSGIGAITTSGGTTGNPSAWTYWTFSANAGDNIDWQVNRLVGELDPVANVVMGNLAGAAFGGSIFDSTLMGLPNVSYSDDSDAPNVPGPWGDPHGFFVAPTTGVYTIAVSSYASADMPEGGYLHEVIVTGSTAPTPGAAAVLALGGLAGCRRRR
jgi:MYXO-CTERM domain-containing protein